MVGGPGADRFGYGLVPVSACDFGFGPRARAVAWLVCRWLVFVALGGSLVFHGFAARVWLPGAWRSVPVWTGLVFGACSPVRSEARAGWAADLVVEDCSSASRYLEFCGFAVVRWLAAPVQTGLGMDWFRFRLVISGSVRGLRWLRGWCAGGRSS